MIPVQRSCDVETLADFSRYYTQSWVGWHPTDSTYISPCYVGGLVDGEHVQLRPLSKEEDKYLLGEGWLVTWTELKEHLDFGIPDIGMMQDGPTILFCSYTTPRAARKGLRIREVRVADFNNWAIRKKHSLRHNNDRYDWIWSSFNPEYSTLEQAEDKINRGEIVGCPLSRTLGVYSLAKYRHSLLAYKRWTVGHIVTPYLIHIKKEYADYEEDIARQTGAEVLVG
jgi:hypothetical protein